MKIAHQEREIVLKSSPKSVLTNETTILLPVALAVLFAAGAFATIFTSTVQILLQRLADDHMRGRVMSLFTICVLGMWPLGSLPLAGISDRIGVQAAVSGGAVIAALVITAALWLARRTVSALPR